MIVMKFGGTSVGSVDAINKVAKIVKSHHDLQPIVVVSAMSRITDVLGQMARESCQGALPKSLIEEVKGRHIGTAETLLDPSESGEIVTMFVTMFEELENIFRGIALLQELTPRTRDLISSFGERLSAPLVAATLRHHGVAAEAYDARQYIKTNQRYTEAEVEFDETNRLISDALIPVAETGTVPVITGFVGSTPEGVTTTLGRGASDYTASIVASAVHAAEIWIWTDVDGAMSADPRIVTEARVIEKITYHEAAEMSYFGAKVLHPKTMLPAVKDRIPIRIKNTFNSANPGTLISDKTVYSATGVKTVTSIDRLCLVTIEGSGLIGLPDTPARVFQTTAAHRVNIIMITQASSEHDICILIDEKDRETVVSSLQEEFRHELERGVIDGVTAQPNVAVVAVVGEGMKGTPGIAARTFGILGDHQINIITIAQGSSELNISFVVDHDDLEKTVRLVHNAFDLDSE
ncbi:MAG: aspartate kinase [Gemmatimonadota bacterium]|nr:aspartate kinase [Gemmatimonadota bacterium]